LEDCHHFWSHLFFLVRLKRKWEGFELDDIEKVHGDCQITQKLNYKTRRDVFVGAFSVPAETSGESRALPVVHSDRVL
jgi:hypothetical protein